MTRLAWVGLSLLACGAPQDKRCSVENCTAMVDACQTFVTGMPNTFVCRIAGLTAPTSVPELAHECIEACNAGGAGAVLACVGERKMFCDLASQPAGRASVVADCTPVKTVTPSCVMRCNDLGNSCDRACPTDTWAHCYACVRSCGLNRAACQATCTAG